MQKALAAVLVCAFGVLAAPGAQAADLLFLRNSPASKFNAADFKLLRANVDKALAGPAEGPPLAWKNDKSGASGTVTPDGVDSATPACRKLRIANAFATMKDEGSYIFCRGNTGQWKLK
jgi:surface antigen